MCELLIRKWFILRELVYILQIPLNATIEVQHHDLTLSDVFGIWTKMKLHLNACVSRANFKTSLERKLVDAFNERQNIIFSNPFMNCALFLDPRFRGQISSNQEVAEEAIQMLCKIWRRITFVDSQNNQNNQTNTEDVSDGSFESFEFDANAELNNLLMRNIPTEQNGELDIERELQLFQPEFMPAENSVLDFWKREEKAYPELHKLAMAVYSIPPTEVQIERDFSKFDYIFSNRRCRLETERLKDIMIININPQIFLSLKKEEIEMAREPNNMSL